jgi:hypothetical protein
LPRYQARRHEAPGYQSRRVRLRYTRTWLVMLIFSSVVLTGLAGLIVVEGVQGYLAQRDGITGVLVVSSCDNYQVTSPKYGCLGDFHADRGGLERDFMLLFKDHPYPAGSRLPAQLASRNATDLSEPTGGLGDLFLAFGLSPLFLLLAAGPWLAPWIRQWRLNRQAMDLFT